MISNPYKDIPDQIQKVLDEFILPEDSYHQVHKRRFARTLDLLMQENPKGKLLELGTSKVIPMSLQQLAPELEVHVTDFMLHLPPKDEINISLSGQSRTCPAYRVDLEQTAIPVPDETFDYVLCCEVIEHLELDPMFMMSEINRVLKPKGTLILTTPNITSTRALWKILRGYEPYFYMQYRHVPKYHRHNYEYSERSIREIVKSAGFTGRVWSEDSFEDPVMQDVNKLREIGYSLDSIGDNIFSVAKKTKAVVDRHPAIIYAD